jgi:hypothetical protein
MTDLIPRALHWLRLFLAPGTGKRRRTSAHRHRPFPVRPAAPLPRARSPYGLHTPLDVTTSRLVRPYLVAHERDVAETALQQRRRLALVLAADFGIDLDRHLIGAREVAA